MGRIVETLLPSRMGTSFRWLIGSSWISNLGDGLALAAGPLLVASKTHDPLLVALAGLLQRLPWLVLGLYAGVLADRLDRRLLVVVVDLMRAGVLVVLSVAVFTGQASILVVLITMLLLGVAEVFADTASGTLLPMVVEKSELGVGNARLMAGFLTANQLIGPPIGAAIFAAGAAWPFVTQAVCVALGAVLISRMRLPPVVGSTQRTRVWSDMVEGFRWTWGNGPVRTLTITIVTFNVTFGAAWSVLVLYSIQRLHMGPVGFGLLTTAGALGGALGIASYDWLARRVSLGMIMRVGLIIETSTHLAFALTTIPWLAMAIMFGFGAHAFIWGTTSRTVRMRAVPIDLQGRVGSVYLVGVVGGIVIGQAIGGVVARLWGVTGPFWFAFVGSAIILALIWRELALIAHADEEIAAAPG